MSSDTNTFFASTEAVALAVFFFRLDLTDDRDHHRQAQGAERRCQSIAFELVADEPAVCDCWRRILSAELIEDQKTRLFRSYLGDTVLKNSNRHGHGSITKSERNNRQTSGKRSRSAHFDDSQLRASSQ